MSSKSIQHVSELNEYRDMIGKQSCLVKFTANWCGPCKAIAPIFQQLADENVDTIKCLEIDIDDAQEITNLEDVKSIPYFVFYVGGSRLDNLSLKGSNKELLLKNAKEFLSKIPPKEEPKSEPVVVVPPAGKVLDMSRLTLDDVDESDPEDDDSEDEVVQNDNQEVQDPQYDSDENHNEYGEDVDILIEKTIPEGMVKTEGLE